VSAASFVAATAPTGRTTGCGSRCGARWDSGDGVERRGTKAKGPDGDLRGRRTYLQAAEAAVLRTHLEQFTDHLADARVFTSTTGRYLDVSHLQQRAWKRARELAFPEGHRLRDVGRHAFRHLAVTRWLRAGVPLRTAARWGGWSDVATMLRCSLATTSWRQGGCPRPSSAQ